MRPVLVVMRLVLAQDLPQMGLIPDEGAVQDLAAASADSAGLGYFGAERQIDAPQRRRA
jgi:hypothetical protein